MSATRAQVVAAARSWLGTPFHHQARKKGAGIDCAGLVVAVGRECGYAIEDRVGYQRYPSVARHLYDDCLKNLVEISIQEAKPGSVLLFWLVKTKRSGIKLPQHLGIVGEPDTMVHAWCDAKRVIESNWTGPTWKDHVYAAFDFRGIL